MKNTKQKHSGWKTVLIVVIMVLFAVISLSAAFLQFYSPMKNKTEKKDWMDASDQGETDSSGKKINKSDDDIEPDTPNQSSGKYKQVDGIYNILVVGDDKAAALTDVIMIVNFNVNSGKLSILQIPRDTYIDSRYSYSNHMNGVYNQHLDKTLDEKKASLDALHFLEETLEDNLCINIHYSVIIDLDGFDKIVDALGGVEINIPFDMHYEDPYQDLVINLKAGVHQLTGEQAEGFIRFRETYVQADIGRLDAQKIFMSSLLKKVKSMDYDMMRVINEVLTYMNTDLNAFDILYFARKAMGIDLEDVNMFTLPTLDGPGYCIVMNRESVLDLINEHFNVYNINITDSVFDRNLVFTDEKDPSVHNVYKLPKDQVVHGVNAYMSSYTAQDAVDDSIEIPRKP